MVLHLDDGVPGILRPISNYVGIDVFQRVTSVDVVDELDPKFLPHLARFANLESVSFEYDRQSYHSAEEIAEFLGAIRLYASLFPKIQVAYPDQHALTAFERAEIRIENLFGTGDPFGSAELNDDDYLTDDPFVEFPTEQRVAAEP